MVVVFTSAATLAYFALSSSPHKHSFSSASNNNMHVKANITANLPKPLLNRVYNEDDFVNEQGIVPSFWGEQEENVSDAVTTWGPCFPPQQKIDWNEAIDTYVNKTEYHPVLRSSKRLKSSRDLSDYCRPGFIIIGAGKCGTSSLYHYITGHPRVLPASQKQIHYFKVNFCVPYIRAFL